MFDVGRGSEAVTIIDKEVYNRCRAEQKSKASYLPPSEMVQEIEISCNDRRIHNQHRDETCLPLPLVTMGSFLRLYQVEEPTRVSQFQGTHLLEHASELG